MKTKIGLMVSIGLIVFLLSVTLAADNKDFYESGQIVDGEVWNMVNIYNDDTVVDMSGGMCDYIAAHNGSTLNIDGGQPDEAWAMDASAINISGGTLSGGAVACANGIVTFSDSAWAYGLSAYDSGVVNMMSGTVHDIGAVDSGIVNLHGGTIFDEISAWHLSVINIYGYNLFKSNSGGNNGVGWVSGYWMDDVAFNIDFYGSETHSHIVLIPEPLTIWLLGLGCLRFMRKRTCKVIQ